MARNFRGCVVVLLVPSLIFGGTFPTFARAEIRPIIKSFNSFDRQALQIAALTGSGKTRLGISWLPTFLKVAGLAAIGVAIYFEPRHAHHNLQGTVLPWLISFAVKGLSIDMWNNAWVASDGPHGPQLFKTSGHDLFK